MRSPFHYFSFEEKAMEQTIKQNKEGLESAGELEKAIKGQPVSRRWVLRNTANATAGVIAVTALGGGATEKAKGEAASGSKGTSYPVEHIADERPQGYVHSLHGWDTI